MALNPSRERVPVELAKPSLHKKDGLESKILGSDILTLC